jgi:hypothetical protein
MASRRMSAASLAAITSYSTAMRPNFLLNTETSRDEATGKIVPALARKQIDFCKLILAQDVLFALAT